MPRPFPHITVASGNKRKSTFNRPRRRGRQYGSTTQLLEPKEIGIWGNRLGCRASDLLPRLTGADQHFISLVDSGDLGQVMTFVEAQVNVNINCQDFQGETPLVVAAKNNDEPMVEYLLSFENIILGDALLHAVYGGNVKIVEMLLNHQRKSSSTLSLAGSIESAEFTADMTPLILAAQCEHYQIIQLLLSRGHTISHPHQPDCFCKAKCVWKKGGESLSDSKARYHAYKALASPAYICQSSSDPILSAFELSKELAICADREREFSVQYMELSNQSAEFAVDLLNQCRMTEEVEILLSFTGVSDRLSEQMKRPQKKFAKVALAIEYGQKKFVAHANCQQVLRAAWLADWQDWRRLSYVAKFGRLFCRFFLLPFIALLYLIVPRTRFAKPWRSPINKCISFAASYLIFLALLYVQNELDSNTYIRGPPDTGLEWCIVLYILGLLWMNVKRCWKNGLKKYFNQSWSWYDAILLALFLGTFFCWGWAWYIVKLYDHKYAPRRLWSQYDPTLVGEALYAVATIIAFGKLLFFFQMGNRLGPLQVSISRMFKDIADFLIVFLIILVSFATGIHKLYHYYKGQVRHQNGVETAQSDAFISFQATVKTLFYALFGYSPPSYADVVVGEQIYHIGNITYTVINKHKFTEAVGNVLFGTYNVAAIIILVNLLIAMMSTSFVNVQNNSDEEWKFARTDVWMTFFDEGTTLPPPFNLVPSPKTAFDLGVWVVRRITGEKRARCSLRRCCYNDEPKKTEDYDSHNYQSLMGQLVQRYLSSKEQAMHDYPVTVNDLDQVRQELKDMKLMVHLLVDHVQGDLDASGITYVRGTATTPHSITPLQLRTPKMPHFSQSQSPNIPRFSQSHSSLDTSC